MPSLHRYEHYGRLRRDRGPQPRKMRRHPRGRPVTVEDMKVIDRTTATARATSSPVAAV
jgi:hypothetical protein